MIRCAYHRSCGNEATFAASFPNWHVRQPLCRDHATRRAARRPGTVRYGLDGIPVVYLICLEAPLSDHARHYLGSTLALSERLDAHASGNGSRFMAAVADAGIDWELVAAWKGDRRDEARMKRQKNLSHKCPRCRPKSRVERGSKRVGTRRYPKGYVAPEECGHRKPKPTRCKRCARRVKAEVL